VKLVIGRHELVDEDAPAVALHSCLTT
jgi:hypothetical protein